MAVFDRPKMAELHPAFYIALWIFFSNLTIIFNKWLLDTAGFPIILTTIHLTTSTVLTQLLARFTPLLNSRFNIKLSGRVYLRTVLPIGALYTLSLLCSNLAYLYLSVPFIQMLKALGPVTTIFLSFFLGFENPKVSKLCNVLIIAGGVLLSSLGEVKFSWTGFGYQMSGTLAESLRLLFIQRLLTKDESPSGSGTSNSMVRGIGMDPLVGLYYYAPVCAVLNGIVALVFEMPTFNPEDMYRVGLGVLAFNGLIAFLLNVASVFLIGRTNALAMSLTGILKSILLIAAAMIIWQTPLTLLQGVGYFIALVAMCYYSMGGLEEAKGYFKMGQAWLSENGVTLFSSKPQYQVVPSLSEDRPVPDVERGDSQSRSSERREDAGKAEDEKGAEKQS